MSIIHLQLLAIIFVTSLACALPGNFLILSGNALIVDAISHAILLGIVVMFLYIKNLYSPLLFVGAIIAALATVYITEFLHSTKLMKHDAAIGLTFPFLFSIAVILINQFARFVHLDTDAVLLGELAFTPFNHISLYGYNLGPVALWTMSSILIIQIVCIVLFYKELVITLFDPQLSQLMQYTPPIIRYLLMTLISISATGAFHTAGTILVIALIIIPPATAYLMTHSLYEMILLSCLVSLITATHGYLYAHIFNSSIAGSIATCNGILFGIIFTVKMIQQYLRNQQLPHR
jgi:manganese/zinc/iron transport system permease protein